MAQVEKVEQVSVAPDKGVEEEKTMKEKVRESVAIVSSKMLKTIQLNNKTLITSDILKRVFNVEIIDVKDEFELEPDKYYIINMESGKLLDDTNRANYIIDTLSTEYTEPYKWSKNVDFDTYNDIRDIVIYDKNKPAFIVRDNQYDRNLEITILMWDANENKPKIRIIYFNYDDGNKDMMLEYIKKIVDIMEPYL